MLSQQYEIRISLQSIQISNLELFERKRLLYACYVRGKGKLIEKGCHGTEKKLCADSNRRHLNQSASFIFKYHSCINMLQLLFIHKTMLLATDGFAIKSLSDLNVNKIRVGNYLSSCLTHICIKHMLQSASLRTQVGNILLNRKIYLLFERQTCLLVKEQRNVS